ncbi:MAG: UDP-N-acetylglucosamine-peptide N-acetylglucosaminyltransferase, partial [Rhizobium sp.]|nr:UDP-N-acetylglucosamine-peptide N-acetylglucosaminyltransferase [Rhizobium sp.]
LDRGARPGWSSILTLQGTSYAAFPVSYYLSGEIARPESERQNDTNDFDGGLFRLGIRPTLTDTVVLFGNKYQVYQEFPGQTLNPSTFDHVRLTSQTIGGAWSHTVEERNVVQAFAVQTSTDSLQRLRLANEYGKIHQYDQQSDDRTLTGGVSHLYGIGPVTLRYGLEATRLDSRFVETEIHIKHGYRKETNFDASYLGTRSYLDATWDVTRDLQFQGATHRVRIEGDAAKWGPLDYRLGGAWAPLDGHWLRAYYRQDTGSLSNYTLSPISTVGLAPMELPLFFDGQTRTAAIRWDAEWSDRFLHQRRVPAPALQRSLAAL